jgi:hypothetical protein
MVKLSEHELRAGSHERALRTANRAIEISTLREDAHRLVMQALAAVDSASGSDDTRPARLDALPWSRLRRGFRNSSVAEVARLA